MRTVLLALAVVLFLLPFFAVLAQGPLDPPGAPAPMMKTLAQMEPRTPITNVPVTISAPGSYYLTDSFIGVVGWDGITIDADAVTLDLNGFKLTGKAGSLSGIRVASNRSGISIRNGSVEGWGQHGIDASSAFASEVLDVRARTNELFGIWVGKGCRVARCTAHINNLAGIAAKDGSAVEDCVARWNPVGIGVENGCLIRGCTANENTANGITAWGKTLISECQVFKNWTNGIAAGHGSIVTKCTVSENGGDGIQVVNNCQVRDNDCLENGRGAGDGAGIHATGDGNRIEGNHCAGADRGLDLDGAANYVADNTVRNNTDNYDFTAGNQLNLLLGEVPESLDWPCSVRFAGTLVCKSNGVYGIFINSDDVTIDLAGHALIGPGPDSSSGIHQASGKGGARIRNGTIMNWRGAYHSGLSLSHAVVEAVDVVSNYHGLTIGGGKVTRCTARKNTSDGIVAATALLTENVASDNGRYGFVLSIGALLERCVASGNHDGIWADSARVLNCQTYANTSNGIVGHAWCQLAGNYSLNHWGGAGILLESGGGYNQVDGNIATANDDGLVCESAGNQIARNAAINNTGNAFDIVSGNDAGPEGSAASATSSWANLKP